MTRATESPRVCPDASEVSLFLAAVLGGIAVAGLFLIVKELLRG